MTDEDERIFGRYLKPWAVVRRLSHQEHAL